MKEYSITGVRFRKEPCLAALSLFFLPAISTPKELKPTSFRVAYSMEADGAEVSAVKACAVVGDVSFLDARIEPAVGERAHEDSPNLKQPISMVGEATDWLKAGFTEIARLASLNSGVAGKPEVSVKLANLWIVELVYRNAEYDGRVVLDVSVAPTGGGAPCWSERIEGLAENYGRAGKEVNYQETVNHALDRAISKTLGSSGFVDALCSCGPIPP